MAKRPTLPNITGQYLSTTQINDAFRAIESAFDNTVSRDGSTPNSMGADLDMDSNDILNAGLVAAETITVNGVDILDFFQGTLPNELTEYVFTVSGDGASSTIELPTAIDDVRKLDISVNGISLRPTLDFTVSGRTLSTASGGSLEVWPEGSNNILIRIRRQLDLGAITTEDITHGDELLSEVLESLYSANTFYLADYLPSTELANIASGNTAAQNATSVVSAFNTCLEEALAATFAVDGASIVVRVPAGAYSINNRLMSDTFNNTLWNAPTNRTRSRIRLIAEGPVILRLQGWVPGRASMRTDGIYAGSTVIAPNAVFEWFQPTGLQNFGGMSGQWIIEGANSLTSDPVGFYFYRLNATRLEGMLEVRNLRNRNFVFDSIFNSEAEYVRSQGAAGISLTEAGGTGLLPADTVVGNVRTGIRYTLSGATITLNTMVYDNVAGTYSFTPASIFTADHVGKWIGLDRQGQENILGDDSGEGGSTRRSTRWFQIVGVTDGATATLATTPPQQGTTGQMAAQNRMVSFEALTVSTTAGSTTATLSMPTTTSLVGLEIAIGGVPYNGGPTDQPNMVAMVIAHTGSTLTLSHAAGVTKSGAPLVLAPQVHIGNCAHTWDKPTSRKCDDFHIGRLWCESGGTPAVPLFIQRTTNVTLGEQSKLHGSPTSTQNFGANWCCVFGGEIGGRWQGRFTHSRHSRRFGMFTFTGDRTEVTINGELSSWTPDDQTSIFYLDPANVATTRIWDIYFNAHDYASGFPITAGGQVFERGGANYTPGRVKAGASQRNPRGERPSWPPAFLPTSRAPAWGTTRADAEAAVARGWVPENGVVYKIGGLDFIGQTGATANAALPGLVPHGAPTRDHFSNHAEFTAYIASLWPNGGFPTPTMTRFDLPPQSIDIMSIGVVPSNLSGDAANNRAAIQDVIDWLAGKTNGGTISGTGFHPQFSNPIITLDAALIWKPKVSFEFGPNVRFRATAAMDAMVDTPAAPDTFIRDVKMLGGYWDAGQNADRCFRIREFENLTFGGPNMTLHRAKRNAATFGDPLQADNCYGLKYVGGFITNHNTSYGVSAVAGIEILQGLSDSDIEGLTIIGYPVGMTGKLFGSRVQRIHAWSYPLTQGPLQTAIQVDGGRNSYIQCQSDNPYTVGYDIIGGSHYRFDKCTSTMGVDDLADPGKPATGTISVFRVASGVTGVQFEQCFGNDRDLSRFGTWAIGDLSDTWIDDSNYSWWGPAPVPRRWGWVDTFAQFDPVTGTNPTIIATQNCSVNRFGDADYSIVIDEDMKSTLYQAVFEFVPVAAGTALIPSITTKTAGACRFQIRNDAGALTMPARVTVRLIPLKTR